jgi:cell division protein FtsQ
MKHWRKILGWILWSLIAIVLIVLFVIAWRAKSAKKCAAIKIELVGNTSGYLFMDEKEILKLVNEQGATVGSQIGSINLYAIEQSLMATKWVEKAKIYIDNQQQLNIQIEQRVPIARVFTASGNSFYIDKIAQKLPLRNLSVMRLPVFTGFPSDQDKLSKPDSALLQSILHFSSTIQKDSFFLAQIAQINIAPNGDFEMVPTLGDHLVLFGKVENVEDKLNRLYTFYKKVLVPSGLNAYSVLDLRFEHQVVALKKGMQPIQYDANAAQQINLEAPIKAPLIVDSTIKDSTIKKLDTVAKKLVVKEAAKIQKVKEDKKPEPVKIVKLPKPKVDKPIIKKQNSKQNNKTNKKTLNNTEPTPRAILPKKVVSNNNKNN